MASGARLLVHTDFFWRNSSLICLRITKFVNSGRNNLSHLAANYSTSPESLKENQNSEQSESTQISRAMQTYLQRTKEYETFIEEQVKEFEKGKIFLARIMGKDPDAFTEEQIDEAVEYLFPSGLHEPRARPLMKHPHVFYAKRKESQFDKTGRPYHFLFYTSKPNFSQVLHDCAKHLHNLNEKVRKMGPESIHPTVPLNVVDSVWLKKQQIEAKLSENILDIEYTNVIEALERLIAHPYSYEVADFIMKFREKKAEKRLDFVKPNVQHADYQQVVEVDECRRKTCRGKVKLIYPGTGKLTINGLSLIDFFEDLQPRHENRNTVPSQPLVFSVLRSGLPGIIWDTWTFSLELPDSYVHKVKLSIDTLQLHTLCIRFFLNTFFNSLC